MKRIVTLFVAVMLLGATQLQAQEDPLALSLPVMNGEEGEVFNSGDHPGKAFVIEFLFNRCIWCNRNAPNVEKLAEDLKDNENVMVLDITIDQKQSQIDDWMTKHPSNHKLLKDVDYNVIRALDVRVFPTVAIVDCNGFVTYKESGAWNETRVAEIKAKVAEITAQDYECPEPPAEEDDGDQKGEDDDGGDA